jgi:[glutamine synthetase] adenylyltransferase / [glutamine synthetase]-adenylyl-L-tyrosine phosphorylase
MAVVMLEICALTDPAAALSCAPYLNRLTARGTTGSFAEALARVEQLSAATPFEQAMAELRRAKSAAHLALAMDDLTGARDVMQITASLTDFAGACLAAALRVALQARGAHRDGMFLVALGKMGAHELNYSSDIDIAAFYDAAVFDGGDRGPSDTAQRVVRDVLRLMHDVTEHGYVFRTDLRLRPDPSSTPAAVSTEMAEAYYESVGQNWERMVWIKARIAAGDAATGARFLQTIQPFVWRRNLDYWAIGDIQAIKRMINAQIGDATFETPSADVKLSPGGIREIEFFVQTQQLILGGRNPALRDNTTLGALAALQRAGSVSDRDARTLGQAYRVLRNLEHRIQMRHDEQTHTLPADPDERAAVAALCGYADLAKFDADVLATRRAVHAVYRALFAAEDRAAGEQRLGNLVFTGVDDDPGTVQTLTRLGFTAPSPAIDTIRNWHRGHVPATRAVRGRELLTALLPPLLEAMGKTGEADEAFGWFAKFFGGLSSGVQTLSMLLAEPALLNDLVATLALAPRLAEILARRPDLLETLVGGHDVPAPQYSGETAFDVALDDWRRYHREQAFLIGHRLLHGVIQPADAGAHWSALADATIAAMSAVVAGEAARRSGTLPGRWAVFALGKLGGREMTAGSDLDLMLIYAGDPLETVTVYTRFTQRLVTALTAPTAEGGLYDVDLRLRPSGRKGPVAVAFDSFCAYQQNDAWTWEHMAMTRLRFVAGDAALGDVVMDTAHAAMIARAPSAAKISADIADMRRLLYREKPGGGLWDLKSAPGGLVDAEFIMQKLQLQAGEAGLICANTIDALARIAVRGPPPGIDTQALSDACRFLQSLQQIERVALGSLVGAVALPRGLQDCLCRAVEAPDFATLESRLTAHKRAVHVAAQNFLQLGATENAAPPV